MKPQKVQRKLGTHDGSFHADEVTACALLVLFDLIDGDKIVRTRDEQELETCEYVCDVGGYYDPERKIFDHHQSEYGGPLSSAGMVLLYLKDQQLIEEKEYRFLNHVLIWGVDAHDNGKDPLIPGLCSYSHIVSNFMPISYDATNEELDQAFFDALAFAKGHLRRTRERYQYAQSCREVVFASMKEGKECLMFEKSIPWIDLFFEMDGLSHPAQFVVMPSGNFWKLRGIPPSYEDRMKVRLPLPEDWAGLLEDDLKKVSGIPGAVFCHKGRFISVWETKEDALKALEYVLNQTKENL